MVLVLESSEIVLIFPLLCVYHCYAHLYPCANLRVTSNKIVIIIIIIIIIIIVINKSSSNKDKTEELTIHSESVRDKAQTFRLDQIQRFNVRRAVCTQLGSVRRKLNKYKYTV